MLNLVAVRVGSKYGPEYVAILFDQLIRNLSSYDGPMRLWCITDDPASLPEQVTPIPHDPALPGWWQKVRLFSPDMPWKTGERVAYFDLDVCITGRLEDLVETPGIIKDWHWPCYNSSVMVWNAGDHYRAWAQFSPMLIHAEGAIIPKTLLPAGEINGGDQEYLTEIGGWQTFPPEWTSTYRDCRLWPPGDCKVVSFNGKPKPHEIHGGWVADTWKIGGLTSLPRMTGVNTTHEVIEANIASSLERGLEWFTGRPAHDETMVLICGGPSMSERVKSIRDRAMRKQNIVSVNNSLSWLMRHGIKPKAHIMLDARPENAAFVKDAPAGVTYFIATQCHPDVFDALKGRDVVLWHAMRDGHEDPKDCIPIAGGGTVGLRAMWLAYLSGYRKLHIYGMDGSYEAGRHHAYAQALNDRDQTLDVMLAGKRYTVARWMARQADEARQTLPQLSALGMRVQFHGTGLIPDMARIIAQQEKAAA